MQIWCRHLHMSLSEGPDGNRVTARLHLPQLPALPILPSQASSVISTTPSIPVSRI